MADRALFLAGRYNKFSRTISQTPWMIDGKKKVTDSVEDFIKAPIMKLISAQSIRFSSSGREDVDVRMLGQGRPFVIEMIEPDQNVNIESIDLGKIASEIAESSSTLVTVRDLQWVTRAAVNEFRKEDTEKKKCYSAVCCASREISDEEIQKFNDNVKEFIIHQKTPTRVLHRRPLATRDRTVFSMHLSRDAQRDNRYFKLQVETEAGAYIKELVHSDFGRTKPSLGDLLGNCRTDIISLDVADVMVDWPSAASHQ